jgi:hypothetical protein
VETRPKGPGYARFRVRMSQSSAQPKMCARLPVTDSEYLARVSSRIVRMFERYIRNINPEEEGFQAFLSNYPAEKNVKDIQVLPYSELYMVIKEGIREYLRKQESSPRSEK